MVLKSRIKKTKNGYYCRLEIMFASKYITDYGKITYILEKVFPTKDDAMIFYCWSIFKENGFVPMDIPLANKNSNIKLSPTQYVSYLNLSKERFPELWI